MEKLQSYGVLSKIGRALAPPSPQFLRLCYNIAIAMDNVKYIFILLYNLVCGDKFTLPKYALSKF